jgi:Uma2 family endonuclease
VLLLVEVADSSLAFDRWVKLPLYARAGTAEVWIVDLKRREIDAHRLPSADDYAEMTTHQPGEVVAIVSAPDILVRLELVFG